MQIFSCETLHSNEKSERIEELIQARKNKLLQLIEHVDVNNNYKCTTEHENPDRRTELIFDLSRIVP